MEFISEIAFRMRKTILLISFRSLQDNALKTSLNSLVAFFTIYKIQDTKKTLFKVDIQIYNTVILAMGYFVDNHIKILYMYTLLKETYHSMKNIYTKRQLFLLQGFYQYK